jgi:hypothetical protein
MLGHFVSGGRRKLYLVPLYSFRRPPLSKKRFADLAEHNAGTGNVFDGVLEVQKGAELDTGSDYEGTKRTAVTNPKSGAVLAPVLLRSCVLYRSRYRH